MENNKIVTRHAGLIAWLKSHAIEGDNIPQLSADAAEIKEGDAVYGVLPMQLIKSCMDKGATVYITVLPNVPVEMRGKEMSPAEMDSAGAKVLKMKSLEYEEAVL